MVAVNDLVQPNLKNSTNVYECLCVERVKKWKMKVIVLSLTQT